MQWVRVTFVMAAGALALAVIFPHPSNTPPPPPQPALPQAPHSPKPYDTIRTDLNDYQWPTDAGHVVTSTFGEYRSTHFHGGIDISTGDVTGYRVFASRSGEVERVVVSPTGYGKMLYLRHPDGYSTTYAHLLRFSPAIERRVRAEQQRLERYPVTVEFPRGEFPVQKGDLIAFTGESGSGSPHLHFEIRDESMNSVNPLLAPQLISRDEIPPEFRKIAFSPLTPGSSVNNSMDPVSIQVRMVRPRAYTFAAPVSIVGAAGIGVYVRDRGDGTRYSRGVYRHRLFVDGRLHFEVRFDRVPMRESQQIGLYYIRDLLRERAGRFEKLYVNTRNDLPFLSDAEQGTGWLSLDSLAPGKHTIAILSQDFDGNSSQLTGTVTLTPPPPSLTARESDGTILFTTSRPNSRILIEGRNEPATRWKPLVLPLEWDSLGTTGAVRLPQVSPQILRIRAATENGPWSAPAFIVPRPGNGPQPSVRIETEPVRNVIRATLSSDGIFSDSPSLAVEDGNGRRLFPLIASDEHNCWTTFSPSDTVFGKQTLVFEGTINGQPLRAVESVEIFPILPGKKGTITTDDGDFRLDYDSLSVYDTLYLQLRTAGLPGSRTYELLPDGAVLREGFTITLRTLSQTDRDAVYRLRNGQWTLLGRPDTSRGNTRCAHLADRLATVTVLRDSEPPAITNLRCAWHGTGKILASFRVWDRLSGVDYKALKVYIDGKFVVPEIDGEYRRATVLAPEGLTRGPHHLQVRVQDNMGNPAILERGFVVP